MGERIDLALLIRGAGAVAAALWNALAPLVQLLIILMALDIITGIIAAFYRKAVSSEVAWRGIGKKMLVLVLVYGAYAIERYAALPVPLGVLIAGFYAAHEGLSILENAAAAGLPIPDALREALAKLNPAKPNSR